MRLPRGLLPLRHPRFRLLVAGQLGSNVGDAFYTVALPWYVLSTHGGAVLLAAYGVPRTVLLAVGGHASDRWRPWTVMMASDTVRFAVLVALAVVAATATPEVTTPSPAESSRPSRSFESWSCIRAIRYSDSTPTPPVRNPLRV